LIFIAIWPPEYVPLTTVVAVAVSTGNRWLRSARDLLPVDVIEPVALDDLRDDFARLEELEFSTGQRAQA
jgi:hypothetical protein